MSRDISHRKSHRLNQYVNP